jgi:hypothetical protein
MAALKRSRIEQYMNGFTNPFEFAADNELLAAGRFVKATANNYWWRLILPVHQRETKNITSFYRMWNPSGSVPTSVGVVVTYRDSMLVLLSGNLARNWFAAWFPIVNPLPEHLYEFKSDVVVRFFTHMQ